MIKFSNSDSFWKYTKTRAVSIGAGLFLCLLVFVGKDYLSEYIASLLPVLGVTLLLLPLIFDSIIKPGFLEIISEKNQARIRFYKPDKTVYLWLQENQINELLLGRNARLQVNVHRAGGVAPLQLEVLLYKDEESHTSLGTYAILDEKEFADFQKLVDNLPTAQRNLIRVYG